MCLWVEMGRKYAILYESMCRLLVGPQMAIIQTKLWKTPEQKLCFASMLFDCECYLWGFVLKSWWKIFSRLFPYRNCRIDLWPFILFYCLLTWFLKNFEIFGFSLLCFGWLGSWFKTLLQSFFLNTSKFLLKLSFF